MALRWDGSTGFFEQTAAPLPSNNVTMAAWVRPNAGSGTAVDHFLSIGAAASGLGMGWATAGNWGITDNGNVTKAFATAANAGEWWFLAFQHDGANLRGWARRFDWRSLQFATVASGALTLTGMRFGNSVFDGTDFADGRAAGLRIWSRLLSAAELLKESFSLLPVSRARLYACAQENSRVDLSGFGRTFTQTGTVNKEPGPPVPVFNNPIHALDRVATLALDDLEARLPVPEPEEVDEEVEPRPQEALDAVLSAAPPPPTDDPEVRQWAPEPDEEFEEPIAEVTFIAPEAFADGPEARDELEWQEEYDEGVVDVSPETTPAQFADGPEARDFVELQEEPDEGWSEPALDPVETTFADGPEAREGAELREEEPEDPAGVEAELIDAQAQAAADDPEARHAAAELTEDEEPTLEQADAMLTAAPAVAPDDPEARDGAVLEDAPDEDLVDQLDATLSAPVALDDLEAREQIVDEFVVEEAANEPTIEGDHSIDDPVVLDDLGARELVIAATDDETGDVPDTFVATFEEGVLVITRTAPSGRHPTGKRHRSLQFKPLPPPLVEPKLPEPALVSDDGDVEAVVRAFIALVWRE